MLTSKLIHLLPTPASASSHPPVPPVSLFSTTTLCPPRRRAHQVPCSPYPGASLQLSWPEAPPCVCPQAGPPAGGWERVASRGSKTCHWVNDSRQKGIVCRGRVVQRSEGPAGEAFGECGFDTAASESPGAWSGEPRLLSFQACETHDFTLKGSETKERFTSETINHLDFSC